MKRVGRIIFNWLTVVSVLLFVGLCGLWTRSFYVADSFSWHIGSHVFVTGASRGEIAAGSIFFNPPSIVGRSQFAHNASAPQDISLNPQIRGSFGFYWYFGQTSVMASSHVVFLPAWVLVLGLLAFTAWF